MWAIGQDEDEAALALLDHGHPIEAGSLWMACRRENNAMIRTLSERAPHLSWQKKSTEKYEDTDDYNYRRELLDNDPDLFEELMEKEKSRKQRQGLDQATPSVKRQRSSRL